MFIGFVGWVDAGTTGAQTLERIGVESQARTIAELDVSETVDFSHTRPSIWGTAGQRHVEFPRVLLDAGNADGRDVVVLTGPELSLGWPSVVTAITSMAQQLGVKQMISLAGMPAPVAHARAIEVLTVRFSESNHERPSGFASRPDYRGPTGLNAAVLDAAGRIGIPSVGLWAQIPMYLAATKSVLGIAPLLDAVASECGIRINADSVIDRAELERGAIDSDAQSDVELAAAIDAVEQLNVRQEEPPDAEELIHEIEAFLHETDPDGDNSEDSA